MSLVSRAVGVALSVCLFSIIAVQSQNPQILANADPIYQQLRNLTLSGEAVSVSNLELKRDAATFHLHSGTVCFVAMTEGKVTGAVFVGEGNMVLDPLCPRKEACSSC